MTTSVFYLFKIGIGPSSSHSVRPMRAAYLFTDELAELSNLGRIRVELFGSLGATGHGHGTVKAVILGRQGHAPDTVVRVASWVACPAALMTIQPRR